MKICKAATYDEMSRKAANIMSAQIILKPCSTLGMATGSSPLGMYKYLIERYQKGDLDFSAISTINLDEYTGLGPDNEQSYCYFMDSNLFNHVNIKKENINVPNGLAQDSAKECERYNGIIDSCGGIDMQLLGIGHNGHIGFNEPGDTFEQGTHHVALAESTINANRRFFASIDEVPKHAYTMGIGNIMHARHVLIIAAGEDKAEIIKQAFTGPVTPQVPASVLQLHSRVTLVGDEAALSLL